MQTHLHSTVCHTFFSLAPIHTCIHTSINHSQSTTLSGENQVKRSIIEVTSGDVPGFSPTAHTGKKHRGEETLLVIADDPFLEKLVTVFYSTWQWPLSSSSNATLTSLSGFKRSPATVQLLQPRGSIFILTRHPAGGRLSRRQPKLSSVSNCPNHVVTTSTSLSKDWCRRGDNNSTVQLACQPVLQKGRKVLGHFQGVHIGGRCSTQMVGYSSWYTLEGQAGTGQAQRNRFSLQKIGCRF